MNDSTAPVRRKLIEHSLPLDAINAASSREKSVRHGHPSTLHLWWARRPLAACRAVLFAQLVDDPEAWPDRFPTEVERERERRRLHKIIEDMVEWPRSDVADQTRFEKAIEAARWEIARSVAWGLGEEPPAKDEPGDVLAFLQTKAPPVYDPFCGGGSIPLEAQRLGLRAYGSDLNPVAVLITKALIEFPPKFAGLPPVHPDTKGEVRNWKGAQGLAEDVRRYGRWMHDQAKRRIGHLYPKAKLADGSEATVIAWLWARTVASPDPALKGTQVPLAASFLLSSKKGKEVIVTPVKDASANDGWRFDVKSRSVTVAELEKAKDGTKSARGANFICALSGASIDADYVKAEGKAGRIGARLMAVVAEGRGARVYLSPSDDQERVAQVVKPNAPELEQPMPENPRWFSPPDYGMPLYRDLFTPRQLTALATFSDLVGEARERVLSDARAAKRIAVREDTRSLMDGGVGAEGYADAVTTYLGLAISKMADAQSSLVRWKSSMDQAIATFGRQAIPMVWDYAESNAFSGMAGDPSVSIKNMMRVLDGAHVNVAGHASQVDAPANHYPVRPAMIATDPPYYDNIGYADLSDYFYVWLRRSLKGIIPELFRRLLTPKEEELIATPFRFGGQDGAEQHFMGGMMRALSAMRDASANAPLTAFYAFKQSEIVEEGVLSPGWAAFLQAVVDAGLQIDGTWPMRTELSNRIVAAEANSLAASVVLVCRKRLENAPAIGRREFLRELKPIMAEAILAHQKAGIPLPDRRQAAIGPGIGVFSKYAMVREADDSAMAVATALTLINKEIDALLAEGTEELDAETRFALEWYQLHGYKQMQQGQHNVLTQLQAFNLAEAGINASGLFRAIGGSAKLLTREEMHVATVERYGQSWRPSLDQSFTVWELAQHMARTLKAEEGGVDDAGRLLADKRESGPEVLLVAERMFELATNNRKDSEEALIWNELQTSWPHVESAADRAREAGVGSTQGELPL